MSSLSLRHPLPTQRGPVGPRRYLLRVVQRERHREGYTRMTAAQELRRMFSGGYGKDQRARVFLSELFAELTEMFDENGSYDGWDVQQRIQAVFGEASGDTCIRCAKPADHTLLDCINRSMPPEHQLHPVKETNR